MNETLRIDFLLKEVNSKLIFVMNEDISTEKVSQSSSEKSLRIQIDDKLNFNKHIESKFATLRQTNSALFRLNNYIGPQELNELVITCTITLSIFNYCKSKLIGLRYYIIERHYVMNETFRIDFLLKEE